MGTEQERLKKEKRKAKAKKERERSKQEKEKRERWEREFQELGEYRVFERWWGKLGKIGCMSIFFFGISSIAFLPDIDFGIRIPWLFCLLTFVPCYLKDIKHLLFPVADIIVDSKGIFVQSFYSSPGQLSWEELIEFDDGNIVDIFGLNALCVDGFFVQFRNKGEIARRLNPLKAIYFRIASLPIFGAPRLTVPISFNSYHFLDAVNYFYGQLKKAKEAAQKAEQKAQEEKERVEERKKRLERRWKVQSGGSDGEDSAPID